MMGTKMRQPPLFYCINMVNMIPDNHILRLIDKYIDFSFIRKKTKQLYSHTGRPSVDPSVLIKMLLVGYLYGITSERRLCEEINLNIAYRWFVGLNLDDKVADHSTFSKNRHNRFKESGIFQDIFDEIVKRCIDKGFVSANHLSVDGTLIKANASIDSMEPVVIKMKPADYIDAVEADYTADLTESAAAKDIKMQIKAETHPSEDPALKQKGKKISNKTHRSKTDPDARLARKSHTATKLSHLDNYLMDNKNRIIVGVKADIPGKKGETSSAQSMIKRFMSKFNMKPKTLCADRGYASGEFIKSIFDLNIIPHIPIVDARKANERGIFPIDRFRFNKEANSYICPNDKILKLSCIHNNEIVYRASVKDCRNCSLKKQCTKGRARSLSVNVNEEQINKARLLSKTKDYKTSIRKRKTIESLFGEAKEQMGLRVCKFRKHWNVEEQFLLTATMQNIKRMVKLIDKDKQKAMEMVKDKKDQALHTCNATLMSFYLIYYTYKSIISKLMGKCALD